MTLFGEWTDAQSIQGLVAAGEAYEQLALVERQHAVLRQGVEVFLMDFGLEGANAIRQAWHMLSQKSTAPLQLLATHRPSGCWDNRKITYLGNCWEPT